jgi:hypothetical protein
VSRLVVANLDCEVAWAGAAALPPAVAARLGLLGTTLRVFAGHGDALWLPAPVDPACVPDDGAPRPRLVSGPAPALEVARAGAADPRFAPAAEVVVARAVNDRRFAAALAADLGVALPGARTVTSVDELAAHLAAGAAGASPTGAWVAKAVLTAAGRDRVRRRGDQLDPPTRTRVERLLAVHGALVFEPWMTRTVDVGQGGQVEPGGAVRLAPPHRALVDDGGVVRGVVLDEGAALEPGERDRLAATATAAGRALAAAGYAGPFVVDGFVHEAAGRRALHPLCELNARLTFGLVARAWAERHGTLLALGLGGPAPAGAIPLVSDPSGVPAAWVAPGPPAGWGKSLR